MFSEKIHAHIEPRLMCKFRDWLTGNRQTRALFTGQKKNKKFRWLSRSRFCADRAQNLSEPAPENILGVPKFHQNPYTFGRVIAGRVNIVETLHKVFPILGETSSPSKEAKELHDMA